MARQISRLPAWARLLPLAQQLTLARILQQVPEAEIIGLLRAATRVLPRQHPRGPRSQVTDAMLLDLAVDLLVHPTLTLRDAAANHAQQILAGNSQRPRHQQLNVTPAYLRRTLRESVPDLPGGVWMEAEQKAKTAALLPAGFDLFARLETVLGIPLRRSLVLSPASFGLSPASMTAIRSRGKHPALHIDVPRSLTEIGARLTRPEGAKLRLPLTEIGVRPTHREGEPEPRLLMLIELFPALRDWRLSDLVQLYDAIQDIVSNTQSSCED